VDFCGHLMALVECKGMCIGNAEIIPFAPRCYLYHAYMFALKEFLIIKKNSQLKLIYPGLMNAQEKWTMPIQSWNFTLSRLAIYFEGRLDKVITL
jgi:hypothetical protein